MSDSDDGIPLARQVAARLPLFALVPPEGLQISRLGGLTNLVFEVRSEGRSYCLRLPGKGTEEYIDRAVEAHNARAAARAGVSPEVLHADEAGIMVTRFLEGCQTMTPCLFLDKPGAAGRAARAFKQLHTSAERFEFRFELFSMIDEYLRVLSKKHVDFPGGYHEVLAESAAVRRVLAARDLPQAPCHCDPLCENFLDDGERTWIVDWEYSGMNDPLWDLGDLSVEAGFSAAHDEEMMDSYFPGGAGAAETGRMVIYKAMCDLLWTLWGLIQHANHNPVEDFWAYATNRFERCRRLMDSPGFSEHVAAVERG